MKTFRIIWLILYIGVWVWTIDNFIESIKYRAKNYGRLIDRDYAEAFQSRKNIAINNIFDLL